MLIRTHAIALLLRHNSIFAIKLLLDGNGEHLGVEAEELLDGKPLNLRRV